jgi:putative ABC transport system permease protein
VLVYPAITSSGFPGTRKGLRVRLSRKDAAAVERESADLVEALLPEHFSEKRVLVEGAGRIRRLDMAATDHRYHRYRNFDIGWGRYFDEREVARSRPVAVLGFESAQALFGSPEAALGQRIRVEGRSFEVIGVPRLKGAQYMNTDRPDDRLLLLPVTTAESRLGYDREALSRVLLVPRPGVDPERAVSSMLARFGPRAGFHPDDTDAVRWFDMSFFHSLADIFYAGFMIFIGAAGTITLLIGAVGIANYHLATIAERSTELALARALGARSATLVRQTILESLVVSGGASLLGVALGLGGCALARVLLPPEQFPEPIVSPVVVVVTLLAVLGVAGLAALLPALRVRRLELSQLLRSAE